MKLIIVATAIGSTDSRGIGAPSRRIEAGHRLRIAAGQNAVARALAAGTARFGSNGDTGATRRIRIRDPDGIAVNR